MAAQSVGALCFAVVASVLVSVGAEGVSSEATMERLMPHNELKTLAVKLKTRQKEDTEGPIAKLRVQMAETKTGVLIDDALQMSAEEKAEFERIQAITEMADEANMPAKAPCKPKVMEDTPLPPPIDPQCENIHGCSDCLHNRKCGWCPVEGVCHNAKNPNPDCVHNDDINICPKACPDMFQLNAPTGRGELVRKLCAYIAHDIAVNPGGRNMHMHFADN